VRGVRCLETSGDRTYAITSSDWLYVVVTSRVYGLFYDAVSSVHVKSNGRINTMNNDLTRITKEIVAAHLSQWTE
jgi:hypothetical protein